MIPLATNTKVYDKNEIDRLINRLNILKQDLDDNAKICCPTLLHQDIGRIIGILQYYQESSFSQKELILLRDIMGHANYDKSEAEVYKTLTEKLNL